jgi:hypothetical protein
MKVSPLNFHLSIFIIPDSPTRRFGESLREKRQHGNRLFVHEGRLFSSVIGKKRQFFAQKRPLNLSKVYR